MGVGVIPDGPNAKSSSGSLSLEGEVLCVLAPAMPLAALDVLVEIFSEAQGFWTRSASRRLGQGCLTAGRSPAPTVRASPHPTQAWRGTALSPGSHTK